MLRNDKAFRDHFVLEFVRNSIPNQLRALRKERGWNQEDMGLAVGKPRNVITRLENPNSHIPNLASIYDVAIGCKAALLVKVVPFSRLLKELDAPFSADSAPAIDSETETEALEAWAIAVDEIVEDEEGVEEAEIVEPKILTSERFASEPIIQKARPTHTLPILIDVSQDNMTSLDSETGSISTEVTSARSGQITKLTAGAK
jgi:transcriptional regulator with XRE-family HTH domain